MFDSEGLLVLDMLDMRTAGHELTSVTAADALFIVFDIEGLLAVLAAWPAGLTGQACCQTGAAVTLRVCLT